MAKLALEVVIFVPNPDFDPVGGIVALTENTRLVHIWRGPIHVQIKFLVPDGVQVLGHSSRALLYFPHLYRDVGVGGPAFIFSDKSLCGFDCNGRVSKYG